MTFEGLFIAIEPGGYLLSQEIQLTIIGVEAFHCPVRDGKGVVPPCYGLRALTCSASFDARKFLSILTSS